MSASSDNRIDYSRQDEGRISRALRRLEITGEAVSGVMLLLMILLVTASSLGRYSGIGAVSGAVEIVERYLMVGLVWLTLANTERLSGHVSIDVVMRHAPRRFQDRTQAIMRLVSAVPVALMAVAAFQRFLASLGQATTGTIRFPTAPAWAFVSIGATLLALRLVVEFVEDIKGILEGRPVDTEVDLESRSWDV